MKKLITYSFLFIISVILFSCNTTSKELEKREVVESNFKMLIPTIMESTTSLNDDATLQYQNEDKELYVIVIEDSKEELHDLIVENEMEEEYPANLDGFLLLMSNEEENAFITTDDRNSVVNETINGLKAKMFTNTRRIEGVNVYYKVALIEGKDTYYQVIAWTLATKKNSYGKVIENMVNSFSEIK